MSDSDDDLDKIMNLESDEDGTSADKPSIKSEPGIPVDQILDQLQ